MEESICLETRTGEAVRLLPVAILQSRTNLSDDCYSSLQT
jgi:hypothetical protein